MSEWILAPVKYKGRELLFHEHNENENNSSLVKSWSLLQDQEKAY